MTAQGSSESPYLNYLTTVTEGYAANGVPLDQIDQALSKIQA
jgi:hypothetical protein